jgi:hypothetical protein
MREAFGQLLPFAVAISISPLPIIALLVLLMSSRARISTPAFMLGWIGAIVAVPAMSALLANTVALAGSGRASLAVAIVKLLLGMGMLWLALREWRARPPPGHAAELPHWLSAVQNMRPLAAVGAGFIIYAANPKNVTVGAAAGVLFSSFNLTGAQPAVVCAGYVLVASSTVVLPIMAFMLAEQKVRPLLSELKGWLTEHNAAVMAVLLCVIGSVMLGKSIAEF